METLRSERPCTSGSIHPLLHSNSNIDELSREKEDLLCDTDEKADEEEALSDDSLRLRLSDDEDETENVLTSALDNQDKPETNYDEEKLKDKEDIRPALVPTSEGNNTPTASEILCEEGQYSGNNMMDDNIVIVHEKECEGSMSDPPKLKLNNSSPQNRSWHNYEWRSARASNRPFRNRRTMSGRYRPQPHKYTRYSTLTPSFEGGRVNGMVNNSCYTRQLSRKVQHRTSGKPHELKHSSGRNIESERITNNSEKSKIHTDHSEAIQPQTTKDLNTVRIESSSSNKDDQVKGDSSNENSSVNNSLILGNSKNNSENVVCSNDKSTDIAGNHTILNDNSNEVLTSDSVIDFNHVNRVQINQTSNDTGNHSRDNYNPDSSNQVESSIHIHNKSETIESIKEHDIKNDVQKNEVSPSNNIVLNLSEKNKEIDIDKRDVDKNTELTDESQKGNLCEDNCILSNINTTTDKEIVNNELRIDEGTANNEKEQSNENKRNSVIIQSLKLHKNHGIEVTSNDLTNNEIIATQSHVPEKLATVVDKCGDTRLRNSDSSKSFVEIRRSVENESIQCKTIIQQDKENTTEKDLKLAEKENGIPDNTNKRELQNNEKVNKESKISEENSLNEKNNFLSYVTNAKNDNKHDNVKKNNEVVAPTRKRRRRTKKMMFQEAVPAEDTQVIGRQKRRTAKNAEEIIRKKFLSNDSDSESSDDSDKFVPVNYKMNITPGVRPLSPPSLKQTSPDNHIAVIHGSVKKVKLNHESSFNEVKERQIDAEEVKQLNFVRKFFHRDLNEKLPRIKPEELEELLIQKIVETITMRDEIGKLREQARISERNQEIMRAKCQQLAKQIKDFEMVLSRNAADRRAHNDKAVPPIKINRSVGLQVNFLVDHGMQNLRQLQQNSNIRLLHVSNNSNMPNTPPTTSETNNTGSPRRSVKVRSPRRTDLINGQAPPVSQNNTMPSNIMTTITPAALVVTKPIDTKQPLPLPNQSNIQQPVTSSQQPQQTITTNCKLPNHINRQSSTVTNVAKPRANDLIDLTEEEEKNKHTSVPVITTTIPDQQVNITQKPQQQCFQRVIQTIPSNVAISGHQLPSLRVVQPASQPTPTALVNNMNAPRLAYVMPTNVGSRQLLIASNTSTMRPVNACRPPFPATITYKTGMSTAANESPRVLTTTTTPNVQISKHPAPLPDIRSYPSNPLWKLPPPAPSLKISKVANGIVLSWNMSITDKHAEIASYQLYAYQELSGTAPSTSLWKKVGDVRALPLPMACTLTEFSEGNHYYFAVRAVDTHSRKGQYSPPGNISL